MVMMIVLNAREENEVTIKEPVHLEAMAVYWKNETIFLYNIDHKILKLRFHINDPNFYIIRMVLVG